MFRSEAARSVLRVTNERLESPRARLFAALDLPDDIREEVVAWQRVELVDPSLRVSKPDNLHITLVFLGYQRERDVEPISELIQTLQSPAPRLRFEPEPVPKGGSKARPSLFALDAPSEGAVALQAELEAGLVRAGFHKPEKRPFWPHLTVARVKPESRGSRRPAEIRTRPGSLPESVVRTFDSVRVSLYRSNLRPQGAEYLRLASTELKKVS